ncbi:amino acid adenylation domain-containing protein [Micromonospora sp. NBC_01740]|uniref:non-ribosomal peptide synthetase n=1 Tax=Micromonospora sp. NBC_01740 TaxID=2975986 RepID=UPI002E0F9DEC|nr:non-ribosomal peptide synthetase [Micromonospora sp. NBC_01740]WSG01307.1 amino acid adenylation domain-containing protein [Micromonospora sp. NBC_01740]
MTEMLESPTPHEKLLERRLLGLEPLPEPGIPPASRADPPPLSYAQRRLWILDRLRPGGVEYLVQIALHMTDRPGSRLDLDALRAALDGLVARHEVLRTRYPVGPDGEPVQLIDPPAPVPLPIRDLTHLDGDTQCGLLNRLVSVDREPIDLAAGPVFRALLVRREPDQHLLLLTTHHIAMDLWSEGLLLDELHHRYTAALDGRPADLPPLPAQYADVAAWQRQRTAELRETQLPYWRRQLAGATPVDLPADRPRPAVRDSAGDVVPFTVPAEVAATLGELARRHRATPFMVLLAAYAVVLGRWSGRTDVTVGTPVAGRGHDDVQDLIGLFVDTVVVRADLAGDPTFGELVERVRRTSLDAFAHQELPFEQLVEELAPVRDPARTALFSTMFVWQEAGPDGFQAPGLDVLSVPIPFADAKFDLTLSVGPGPDGSLAGAAVYATSLFDRATIERFVAHVGRLLAGVAAAPDIPLADVDILPPAEREQLLDGWNDTATDVPATTLPALFRAQVAATGDAVAVRTAERSLSYAELDARVTALALRLRAAGVGPESVVGVCLERGPDLVTALLAVLTAGGAYLPLDTESPPQRLEQLLTDAAVRVVVTDRDSVGTATRTVLRPDVDGTAPHGPPLGDPDPEHPAYVLHTSGSTGPPKGVVITHRALVNRLAWMQREYPLDATDRVLHKTPYGFDVSVWELFWPLITGATLVVARPGGHRDPAYLAAAIAEHGVTTLHFVPSMLRAFLDTPVGELPSVRRIFASGEPLPDGLAAAVSERIGCELHNLYGPTEATIDVTAARCLPGEPVTIGRPVANTRAHVVDPDLRLLPVGVPGELVVAGVQLARGYLGRPAHTADRFVPDPFGTRPGDRLYRTGDLARHRADGTIEYLGRLDRQVKLHGHRIEPGEVEAVLTAHPDVAAAVVTVHDDRLVAYLVGPAAEAGAGQVGPAVDRDGVAAYARARLPRQLVPARWVVLDALPLTAAGKVDHRALPAPPSGAPPAAEAPRTPLERTIARAVADALGVDAVGRHDAFFAHGGDSIRAIRAVGALRAAGLPVSVHDLFSHATVAELAELVGARAPEQPAEVTEQPVVAPFALLSEADRALLPPGLVDAYPMGEIQAGMVYEMLAAQRPVYVNVSCYRIEDETPFDLADLQAAAALLVRRHEILRTSFALAGYTRPLQLVHRTAELPVDLDDLRDLPPAERRQVLDEFLLAQRAAPFDLAVPPLLRYTVHQTGEREWWLTHVECHAILDGWSHTSVIAELLGYYRTLRRGGVPRPAPLPAVRFADFVAAEQESLRSAADRDFWTATITAADKLEIPAEWGGQADGAEGPAGADDAPDQVVVEYADLEPALRRLAADAGASLKSVLHAAHLTAWGVVTGRQRFFTGLVGNGRPERLRGDEVIGMYLNTVPFPADLTAASWPELVRAVFAREARMWPHRRYPMAAMRRDGRHASALVDVSFTYLDFHMLDWSAGIDLEADFSPSEQPFSAVSFPGHLRLLGRPSRIGRPYLELVGRTYRQVLASMAASAAGPGAARDPGAGPDATPAVSPSPSPSPRTVTLAPADRERVLVDPNRTDRAFPTDEPVHRLIERQARSAPTAVALRQGVVKVYYAELELRANRLAHRLRALGVGPGTVVGICLPRTPDLAVCVLAVLKAGGAFLPLDPAYPVERLRFMLDDTAAAVLLAAGRLPAGLVQAGPAGVPTVDVTDESAQLDMPVTAPEVTVAPDDLAYVTYTSGSTGRPKGVAVPHRALLNLRHAQQEVFDVRPGDRMLQFFSVGFDASVSELVAALTAGAELVLPEPDRDPGDLRAEAATLTHLFLPPSMLSRLDPADFPRLRVTLVGGEACPAGQADRWARHAAFVNLYGPTEACVAATYAPVAPGSPDRMPSIGTPLANVRCHVLDADGRPLPAGVRGELHVAGAGLARGYLGRPALTADRFVPDPFGPPGSRMYRTGDVVSRAADDSLRFHGRGDQQVSVRGFRIELGEVEHALEAHPSVAAAAVAVAAAGTEEATLVAFVRLTAGSCGAAPSPAELREHVRRQLPAHMVPTRCHVVGQFPVTASGKVDRAALIAAEPKPAAAQIAPVAPRTPLEQTIADAWAQVLRLDRVGIDDDFFDLGGHSMAMMRVISLLRESHGVELTFRAFLEHQTVARLAAAITDGAVGGPEAPAAPGSRNRALLWLRRGSATPLFCIHPGGGSAHWFQRFLPYLDPQLPLAAFEWPKPHGDHATIPTAAEMARRHFDELRAAQPHGPYRLFSWCGGSTIAAELATLLLDAGEEVTFMLLDPVLDAQTRPKFYEQMGFVRRLEKLVLEIDRGGPEADTPERRAEIMDLYERVANDIDEKEGMALPERGVGAAWPRMVRVWRESLQALIEYPNPRYAGKLHLIASDALANGQHVVSSGQTFADYLERWEELIGGGIELHRVPGDHIGIMKPPLLVHLTDVISAVLAGSR